mgnify:FL=1
MYNNTNNNKKTFITFITGNSNKLEEVRSILKTNQYETNYSIKSLDIDLSEVQGEPEYVIQEKCKSVRLQLNGPIIVEDTSLCFNALGGLPGPYIKWFMKKIGLEGLTKLLLGYEDKTIEAKCIFAYQENKDSKIHYFTGITKGTLVEPRGNMNFGWDAVFLPEGYSETYGEMDSESKNSISHRFKALQLLKEFLNIE